MKKILTALFISTILVIMCILSVSAAESGTCGKNLTWTLENGTLTISGTGDMDDYDKNITYTIVDGKAVPVSTERLAPWYDDRLTITSIVVEDGVTSIGVAAFYNCTKVKSVQLSEGLTKIDNYAFENCGALCELVLPQSLTFLGTSALADTNIKAITISKKLTDIRIGAFREGALSSITVDPENAKFCVEDGLLLSKDKTMLYCYPAARQDANYTLPNYVTRIGAYAFSGNDSLRTVTLQEPLKTIDAGAFESCPNLEGIYIPASVKTIGSGSMDTSSLFSYNMQPTIYGVAGSKAEYYAKTNNFAFSTEAMPMNTVTWEVDATGALVFSGTGYIASNATGLAPWYKDAERINKIVVGEGIIGIADYAFSFTHNAKSIELPSTLQEMGAQSVNGLESYVLGSTSDYFCVKDGVLFDKQMKTLVSYPAMKTDRVYKVPDGVEAIAKGAFYQAKMEILFYPGSLRELKTTLTGCNNLTTVVLGDGMRFSLSLSYFIGAKNLTAIYIPRSITEMAVVLGVNYENLTIYGEQVSYAKNYADTYGIDFSDGEIPLSDVEERAENYSLREILLLLSDKKVKFDPTQIGAYLKALVQ